MRKIPTLFKRDPDHPASLLAEVTPGCEWVLTDPRAFATRKYDGTCTMLDRWGAWWARREYKLNQPEKIAAGYRWEQYDPAAGKVVGWEPIERSSFAKWHAEAMSHVVRELPVGTYELIGPKINGNPEGAYEHGLIEHANADRLPGIDQMIDKYRDYETRVLRALLGSSLQDVPYEGVVWHHPDGRMAKLKRKDFFRL